MAVMSIQAVDAIMVLWRGNGGAVGRLASSFLLMLVGLFYLASALLEWGWFFRLRRVRTLRSYLGDAMARWFYVAIGVTFLLISVGMSFGAVLRF